MGSVSTTPLWPFSILAKPPQAHMGTSEGQERRSSSKPTIIILSSSTMVFITAFPDLQRQTVASKATCKEHDKQRILRILCAVCVKKGEVPVLESLL
jgi:hypothetical protein